MAQAATVTLRRVCPFHQAFWDTLWQIAIKYDCSNMQLLLQLDIRIGISNVPCDVVACSLVIYYV